MTVTTRTEQKNAKRNFFLLYAVSLVVGLVAIISLWQKFATPAATVVSPTAESENYFMQMDTLLHRKMERFDDVYAGYVKARRSGVEPATGALFAVRSDLGQTLDSIDQQAGFLSDGPKKSIMNLTAARFRKAVNYRDSLLNDLVVLPKPAALDSGAANASAELALLKGLLEEKDREIALLQQAAKTTPVPNNTAAAAQLQKAITDKDRQIASLQAQLRQKEAALQNAGTPSRPAAGGGEWPQKYASLKAAHDKAVANEKSLKNAYQTVADDNRRLLLQLQSMRKN